MSDQPQDATRDKKIIVALFLILGKALKELPKSKRDISVTEDEIRLAWREQKSPVRVIAERDQFGNAFGDNIGQITFRTVLQELDLKKVGFIPPNTPYPEEKIKPPEAQAKGRVFDLE